MQKVKDIESKDNYRSNFIFAFLGTNRTGKTSIAVELATEWKKANKNGYIISYDVQGNFKHLSDEIIYTNANDAYLDRCLELKDTLMIFDDYRSLMNKNIPPTKLLELMQLRAHHNVDMIFIAHSPAHLYNQLTYFITHYFIFFTLSLDGSFQKKIPNYAHCIAASNYVNKWVRHNGKGKYPKFPFVCVDTQTLLMTAYNMRASQEDITKIMDKYY